MIRFENVSRVYHMGDEDVFALNRINLLIGNREFAVVSGPSGSGKTTLLNLIGGIDSPTEGILLVDGVNITEFSDDQLADYRYQSIGFIFQDFNLIENLDVAENIRAGLLAGRRAIRRDEGRWDYMIDEVIELVGLQKWRSHKPEELSGGQRQRVAIARALVKKPSIILADEPTANLDTAHGRVIIDLMHELNKLLGTICLISTHDERIWDYAERVIKLKDGEIEQA